ncbi:uncharacterized protein LDX57_009347 [Aspergillus melleus]|uniref:uncharacterized protein n=1 Tax=Aspergillus melleus TaxID=138277 RepID=UPI001E8DD83E|nr:uncharacterized protein LDX57_009347 [Aspergillus melleus]KAH8431693.1 hypothetical protein LDX57_009347 [Aspergillus melleus]
MLEYMGAWEWEFTKMDTKKLDHLIRDAKSNSCYMKLLYILSSQLECLLWNGSPDLDKFYTELQEEELLAENELEELQGTFSMQHVSAAYQFVSLH